MVTPQLFAMGNGRRLGSVAQPGFYILDSLAQVLGQVPFLTTMGIV
jgi:hypothetical protein